jgi:predicted HicB family RNase H-like nuclease
MASPKTRGWGSGVPSSLDVWPIKCHTSSMKDDIKTLTVRFPAHLLEQIREVAKQNNRSLNGEILTAVEDRVKKQKKANRQ